MKGSCVENVPPYNKWSHSEEECLEAQRRRGIFAVMTNYTFSCEGEIKQWIIQWKFSQIFSSSRDSKIIFDFHVMRANSPCSVISIGKNRMVAQMAQNRNLVSIFNVTDSERIRVREGDMIGLAVNLDRYYSILASVIIAEHSDAYSLPTNEVHYVEERFDPDSIADVEFELYCSRENNDSSERTNSRQDFEHTHFRVHNGSERTRTHTTNNDFKDRTWQRNNDSEDRTRQRNDFEDTDFRVHYGTPLINAVVGKQPYSYPLAMKAQVLAI